MHALKVSPVSRAATIYIISTYQYIAILTVTI